MDEDFIRSICRRFNLPGGPSLLSRSCGTAGSGGVFRCGGDKFLLRRRSAEHAAPRQVRFEHELLARLAGAGFPVASPLAAGDGRTFAEIAGAVYEVFPWIEGEAYRYGNRAQLEELGRMLGRYHRITAGLDRHKPGQGREDDPVRLLAELEEFVPGADFPGVDGLRAALVELAGVLHGSVYGRCPQAVIHGDLHPGNVKFRGDRLVGLFDFDWANRGEAVRDIGDGIMFFSAARAAPPDPDDIWSLTAGFRMDPAAAGQFLAAYGSQRPLETAETAALPHVMAARWLQVRIRGTRKVPPRRRVEFLDRGDLLSVLADVRAFVVAP